MPQAARRSLLLRSDEAPALREADFGKRVLLRLVQGMPRYASSRRDDFKLRCLPQLLRVRAPQSAPHAPGGATTESGPPAKTTVKRDCQSTPPVRGEA